MTGQIATSFSLPKPVLGYHPGTFLERGASVPFTTPQLNGAYARQAPRRGMEFTVPNPSGGRGVYIVPPEGLFALCRPTLHDSRLIAVLAAMPAVTPTAIRAAARAIAAEGLAGRAVSAAAAATIAIDEKARMMANFELLLELVRQTEAGEHPADPVPADSHAAGAAANAGADLERRARRAVARIAPELGRSTEQIAASLEELAALFAHVGVGRLTAGSRVPRIAAALAGLRDAMLGRARDHAGESGGDAGRIAESADVTLACLRLVLGEVHEMPRDMLALLRRWLRTPQEVAARVARPDWLVDGWERIILLWQAADTFGHVVTLGEMAGLVPVLPKELAEWCRVALPGLNEGTSRRPLVAMLEDGRTGVTQYDVIARNERLLAMAA